MVIERGFVEIWALLFVGTYPLTWRWLTFSRPGILWVILLNHRLSSNVRNHLWTLGENFEIPCYFGSICSLTWRRELFPKMELFRPLSPFASICRCFESKWRQMDFRKEWAELFTDECPSLGRGELLHCLRLFRWLPSLASLPMFVITCGYWERTLLTGATLTTAVLSHGEGDFERNCVFDDVCLLRPFLHV